MTQQKGAQMIKNIDEVFIVYDPYKETEQLRHVEGVFPVVTLGKKEYYCIDDEWFEKTKIILATIFTNMQVN